MNYSKELKDALLRRMLPPTGIQCLSSAKKRKEQNQKPLHFLALRTNVPKEGMESSE